MEIEPKVLTVEKLAWLERRVQGGHYPGTEDSKRLIHSLREARAERDHHQRVSVKMADELTVIGRKLRTLERLAGELCYAADSYVGIGFDHHSESAELVAAVAALRAVLKKDAEPAVEGKSD